MAEYVMADDTVIHERADAARNRRRILIAARALFGQRGVDKVTMDQIAAAAGVGKGTLFRRFGDKSGLAAALLDDGERELRGRVAEGAAPLGPGADPAARLVAFFDAYLTFLTDHLDLVHLAETARPGTRYRIAAYRYWHAHVTNLLTAAGAVGDRESLAHVLLAGVAADLQRAVRAEVTPEGMRASVLHVVDAAVNTQLSVPAAAEPEVEVAPKVELPQPAPVRELPVDLSVGQRIDLWRAQ
ncbi:TetR/AcrR family transcriptional regulator [Actinokineospora diospyrosa]|uniref:Transcriptional regulator, TetR family n=1 Tax=Actinokineospora diospyrosa TaxID=103728 RepID=A0ABT1IL27_9PSEU|nr:TetR/AcrR family transcriptional regulator [Actinokineospora diospyrosa]MCP2273216.1 transcriptional regulator, TetR family [Actinokineospora diospyrosa]